MAVAVIRRAIGVALAGGGALEFDAADLTDRAVGILDALLAFAVVAKRPVDLTVAGGQALHASERGRLAPRGLCSAVAIAQALHTGVERGMAALLGVAVAREAGHLALASGVAHYGRAGAVRALLAGDALGRAQIAERRFGWAVGVGGALPTGTL